MSIRFSIMVPTYNRMDRLPACIQSIQQNAASLANVEILLRITDTDKATAAALPALLKLPNVKAHIGPRNKGYESLCEYHDELADIATGDWLWQWNDDVMMLTLNWDELVEKHLDNEDALYQPEIHRMGGSMYHKDLRCPFFLMHRKHWPSMVNECEFDYYGAMSDVMAFDFAARHMMSTRFVDGLAVHHLRDSEEKIQETRK